MSAENKLVRILELKKDFQEKVLNSELEMKKVVKEQTTDLKKEAKKLWGDVIFFFEAQEKNIKKRNEVLKKIDKIEKDNEQKYLSNVAILEAEFNKDLLHILDGETFMAVSFDLKNKNAQDALNIAYILKSNGFFIILEDKNIFTFEMLVVSKDQKETLSDMMGILENADYKGISFDVKNDVK